MVMARQPVFLASAVQSEISLAEPVDGSSLDVSTVDCHLSYHIAIGFLE